MKRRKRRSEKTPQYANISVSFCTHHKKPAALVQISCSVILVIVLILYNVRNLKKTDMVEAWELDIRSHRFSYEDLKKATKGFGDIATWVWWIW